MSSTPSSTKPPAQSSRQVPARTAEQSVTRAADILRRYGRTEAADHLGRLLEMEFDSTAVVVVGEVKRGKSSLVNALVGRRDLVPVDVVTCTSVPIRVHAHAGVEPRVYLRRGEGREEIEASELPRWATQDAVVEHEAALRAGEEVAELPTSVDIDAPLPGLGRITVVDTAGVGGLAEESIAAALVEARKAGLLIMVCDASTPITQPEMEILRRARTEVGSVIVVVTKIDKNTRRWRAIVEDDRRLIREHLGVEIPVVGVSSLRAADAAELDDAALRADLERRSGIATLRELIAAHLAGAHDLGVRSACGVGQTLLNGVIKTIDDDIRAYQGASTAVEELEAEKKRLETYRENASEWEQLFQRDMQLSRNRIQSSLDAELEQVRNKWSDYVGNQGMRVLRSKPQVFTSQIEVDLKAAMENTLGELIEEISSHANRMFPENPDAVAEILDVVVTSLGPTETSSRDVEKKTKGILDPSVVSMGAIGASLLSAVIPIAPLAGVAWVGINMGYRAMRNGKQHLLTWLRETSGTVRSSTLRMMDTVITTARTEIMLRYRFELRRKTKELQGSIESAQRIARETESERKQKLQRLQRNREIIVSTIDELRAHAAAFTAKG